MEVRFGAKKKSSGAERARSWRPTAKLTGPSRRIIVEPLWPREKREPARPPERVGT
jgi:hypothetical protein